MQTGQRVIVMSRRACAIDIHLRIQDGRTCRQCSDDCLDVVQRQVVQVFDCHATLKLFGLTAHYLDPVAFHLRIANDEYNALRFGQQLQNVGKYERDVQREATAAIAWPQLNATHQSLLRTADQHWRIREKARAVLRVKDSSWRTQRDNQVWHTIGVALF